MFIPFLEPIRIYKIRSVAEDGQNRYIKIVTVAIAVVVTLAISWVGLLILNSLLVLPGASARNIAKNLRQYHLISFLFALVSGIGGLLLSYHFGTSTGAAISLILALCFAVSFCFRKVGA
jgi:zinc transport system permease protein